MLTRTTAIPPNTRAPTQAELAELRKRDPDFADDVAKGRKTFLVSTLPGKTWEEYELERSKRTERDDDDGAPPVAQLSAPIAPPTQPVPAVDDSGIELARAVHRAAGLPDSTFRMAGVASTPSPKAFQQHGGDLAAAIAAKAASLDGSASDDLASAIARRAEVL